MSTICEKHKESIGFKYIEKNGLEFGSDFGQSFYHFPMKVIKEPMEKGAFVGSFHTRQGGIGPNLMYCLQIRTKFDFYRVFRFCATVLTGFSGDASLDNLHYHVGKFQEYVEKRRDLIRMDIVCALLLYTEMLGTAFETNEEELLSFIKLICYVFKLECPRHLMPER